MMNINIYIYSYEILDNILYGDISSLRDISADNKTCFIFLYCLWEGSLNK